MHKVDKFFDNNKLKIFKRIKQRKPREQEMMKIYKHIDMYIISVILLGDPPFHTPLPSPYRQSMQSEMIIKAPKELTHGPIAGNDS